MARFFRREYAADWVAVAYALAYYAWLALRTPGTSATLLVGELSFYPLGLAVGLAYLRNARVATLDRRSRSAWGILGAGSLVLWIVGNTWPRLITVFGAAAYPGWVGVMEIVQHVLLIAAIFLFPGRTIATSDRRRFGADIALVLVAGFVLVYYYGARASAAISPASPPEIAFAQSVLDWVVFVVAAVGVLHKRDAVVRTVLQWLIAATVIYLTANYRLSELPVYRLGDGVDGLWFAAWCCRWTAARVAWHRYRTTSVGERIAPGTPEGEHPGGAFSYVVVAVTFAVLTIRVSSGTRDHLLVFAVAATLMAFLLVARQLMELAENRRLYAFRLAQEARFRSLVQHMSDVVLVADAEHRATYVSPSADRVFGAGVVVAGTTLGSFLPLDTIRALVPGADSPSGEVRSAVSRVTNPSGAFRDLEIVATDMRADPAVRGTFLSIRDVTERNQLQHQLQEAQHLEAVGLMAGGLAHDFNNVLTAIKGYADLLRDDLPEGSPALADLPHIESAVDRAVAVTRKLMAFSRRREPQRAVLDLNAVVNGLEPLLRQMLPNRIEVETKTDASLWTVHADAGQLEQVVVNLVTNARDAMADGGTMRVATRNVRITQEQASPETPVGEFVALAVTDRGTGIPEAIQNRIFEPFFTTKPHDRGLGLGLAVVKTIVAQHDGFCTIESREGDGTTVTVMLPRTSSVDDAPAGPGGPQ